MSLVPPDSECKSNPTGMEIARSDVFDERLRRAEELLDQKKLVEAMMEAQKLASEPVVRVPGLLLVARVYQAEGRLDLAGYVTAALASEGSTEASSALADMNNERRLKAVQIQARRPRAVTALLGTGAAALGTILFLTALPGSVMNDFADFYADINNPGTLILLVVGSSCLVIFGLGLLGYFLAGRLKTALKIRALAKPYNAPGRACWSCGLNRRLWRACRFCGASWRPSRAIAKRTISALPETAPPAFLTDRDSTDHSLSTGRADPSHGRPAILQEVLRILTKLKLQFGGVLLMLGQKFDEMMKTRTSPVHPLRTTSPEPSNRHLSSEERPVKPNPIERSAPATFEAKFGEIKPYEDKASILQKVLLVIMSMPLKLKLQLASVLFILATLAGWVIFVVIFMLKLTSTSPSTAMATPGFQAGFWGFSQATGDRAAIAASLQGFGPDEGIPKAKQLLVGTWTYTGTEINGASSFTGGVWLKWVLKPDGTVEFYEAEPTESDWGEAYVGKWEVETHKYTDTGERWFGADFEEGGARVAIIKPDGTLYCKGEKYGEEQEWRMQYGDRNPFSK